MNEQEDILIMQASAAPDHLLHYVKSELGYAVLRLYHDILGDASRSGLSRWQEYVIYHKPEEEPWPSHFIPWLFQKTFGRVRGTVMVHSSSAEFKEAEQLFNSPELGDIAFLKIGDMEWPGVVDSITDDQFSCIGCDHDGEVIQRLDNVGSNDVIGFGRPDWSVARKTPDEVIIIE